MERHKDLAETHGFTRTIDCGVLTLHMFDEAYLNSNTASADGSFIELADALYSPDELSHVWNAGLELIPESPRYQLELYGYINFQLPHVIRTAKDPYSSLLQLLRKELDDTAICHGLYLEIEGNVLTINTYDQPPVTLKLTIESPDDAYLDIITPLESHKPAHAIYQAITMGAEVWGRTQDIITRADGRHHTRQNNILVGTTEDMTVSELEFSLEANLGKRALDTPHQTLPEWSDDIISSDIQKYSDGAFSTHELDTIADEIINYKRNLYARDGIMPDITQGDIVKFITIAQRQRRQAPDESSHHG